MPRKRISRELVENDNRRNTICEKRIEGMKKKAEELSILCGVEIGIVAHKQRGERNVLLWPSPGGFHEKLQKFLECPPLERVKKMVTHEKFLEQLMKTEMQNLEKMTKAVEDREALQLMAMAAAGTEGGGKPLEQMNLRELQAVSGFAEQMLNDLYKKKEELHTTGRSGQSSKQVEVGQSSQQVSVMDGRGFWSNFGETSEAAGQQVVGQQIGGGVGLWDNFGEWTSGVPGAIADYQNLMDEDEDEDDEEDWFGPGDIGGGGVGGISGANN